MIPVKKCADAVVVIGEVGGYRVAQKRNAPVQWWSVAK